MTITRDQLKAARTLLHLQQPELAKRAKMGVATLRRFEGGQDIRVIYLDALRREIEAAGVILIGGDGAQAGGQVGVVLRPFAELPEETKARLTADRADGDERRRSHADAEPAAPAGRAPTMADQPPADDGAVQGRRRGSRAGSRRAAPDHLEGAGADDHPAVGKPVAKGRRGRGKPSSGASTDPRPRSGRGKGRGES